MNWHEWLLNSILDTFFAILPQQTPTTQICQNVKIVAHRGVHENNLAKENTIDAFQLAVQNNLWAIEFDVRFTSDNQPVVIHDESCERIFSRRDIIVSTTSLNTLRTQVPSVPTLQEVISKFGEKIHLMIEIKNDLRQQPEKILNLKNCLRALRPQIDYHLLSLEPDHLQALDFVSASSLLDVIWRDPKMTIEKNCKLQHGAIAGHFLFLNSKVIKRLRSENKKVGVGFISSKNSLFREINRGADYIFTNHPLRLKQILSNLT